MSLRFQQLRSLLSAASALAMSSQHCYLRQNIDIFTKSRVASTMSFIVRQLAVKPNKFAIEEKEDETDFAISSSVLRFLYLPNFISTSLPSNAFFTANWNSSINPPSLSLTISPSIFLCSSMGWPISLPKNPKSSLTSQYQFSFTQSVKCVCSSLRAY